MGESLALDLIVSLGLVLLLLACGMRIYAVLGLAGAVSGYLLVGPQSLNMIKFIPFTASNSWTLTAIPLFVLVGYLCLETGLSEGLYSGAATLLGKIPGGLLHANIGACAIFATITGSPSATAATISAVALPEMEKRGYDEQMTLGSLAAGGVIGPIIPPSINFIVFGSMTGLSIGKLFFGGMIPGIILTLMFMAYILYWAIRNPAGYPKGETPTLKNIRIALKNLFPIFLVALIVLGGIYFGIFTPTEAGAVGCASLSSSGV